jgi:hypothetical protein
MYLMEELASEQSRRRIEQAEQLRHSRRVRILRRARRMEHRAERRMIAAWRRAAELRSAVEPAEYLGGELFAVRTASGLSVRTVCSP